MTSFYNGQEYLYRLVKVLAGGPRGGLVGPLRRPVTLMAVDCWKSAASLLNKGKFLFIEFQEASVVLKSVSLGLAAALMLAWGGNASASDYKPDDYLGLDLSKAILSPKRLGPPSEFAPIAVEARGEAPKAIATERVHIPPRKVAHSRVASPRGAARAKLAHRHGNPLDAQAMDTRIQTWPCRSGGICNWKR